MYQAESIEGFDSWYQEDTRTFSNQICLAIINEYNFHTVLDIGCGKGTFTHFLKKENNQVVGIDISETALNVAKTKFPDIEFLSVDLSKDNFTLLSFYEKRYDLIILIEVLSYLPNWREVLKALSNIGNYFLISLFIPKNPIGFVKSGEELVSCFNIHCKIIENIHLVTHQKTILFGKTL